MVAGCAPRSGLPLVPRTGFEPAPAHVKGGSTSSIRPGEVLHLW